jgi:4-carboxymuconolactone decarboxylase
VTDPDRAKLTAEVMKDIFGTVIPMEARPGEPDSAAELRSVLMAQAFVDSWTRTALDRKTRSLLTLAILATLGAEKELRSHVGGALKLGVTPDQLVDLFIHVSAYAGVARAGAGWAVASDVLTSRGSRPVGPAATPEREQPDA